MWKISIAFYVADIVKLTCAKLQQNKGTKAKTSDLAHRSVLPNFEPCAIAKNSPKSYGRV